MQFSRFSFTSYGSPNVRDGWGQKLAKRRPKLQLIDSQLFVLVPLGLIWPSKPQSNSPAPVDIPKWRSDNVSICQHLEDPSLLCALLIALTVMLFGARICRVVLLLFVVSISVNSRSDVSSPFDHCSGFLLLCRLTPRILPCSFLQ